MLQCWNEDASMRPSATEVTELLVKPPHTSTGTQLMVSVQYRNITIHVTRPAEINHVVVQKLPNFFNFVLS